MIASWTSGSRTRWASSSRRARCGGDEGYDPCWRPRSADHPARRRGCAVPRRSSTELKPGQIVLVTSRPTARGYLHRRVQGAVGRRSSRDCGTPRREVPPVEAAAPGKRPAAELAQSRPECRFARRPFVTRMSGGRTPLRPRPSRPAPPEDTMRYMSYRVYPQPTRGCHRRHSSSCSRTTSVSPGVRGSGNTSPATAPGRRRRHGSGPRRRRHTTDGPSRVQGGPRRLPTSSTSPAWTGPWSWLQDPGRRQRRVESAGAGHGHERRRPE